MKVTEKFLKVYEDVMQGKIPLNVAQRLFCGGDNKNKWYNLKSRLKAEVSLIEFVNGCTEKDKRGVHEKFTELMKFVYLYEKVLKGEFSLTEAQLAISEGTDNLSKWYNLKARAKEQVQRLERKYHKEIVRGKVVDKITGVRAEKRVAAVKQDSKRRKTMVERKDNSTKVAKATKKPVEAVEKKVKKAKNVAEEEKRGRNFKGRAVGEFATIKECFLHYLDKVLKGEMPEAEARKVFDSLCGKGKWYNYKFIYKDIVKQMEEQYTSTNEDISAVTDTPSKTSENAPKKNGRDKSGTDKGNTPKVSKKSNNTSNTKGKKGTVSNRQTTEKGDKKEEKKEDKKKDERIIVQGVAKVTPEGAVEGIVDDKSVTGTNEVSNDTVEKPKRRGRRKKAETITAEDKVNTRENTEKQQDLIVEEKVGNVTETGENSEIAEGSKILREYLLNFIQATSNDFDVVVFIRNYIEMAQGKQTELETITKVSKETGTKRYWVSAIDRYKAVTDKIMEGLARGYKPFTDEELKNLDKLVDETESTIDKIFDKESNEVVTVVESTLPVKAEQAVVKKDKVEVLETIDREIAETAVDVKVDENVVGVLNISSVLPKTRAKDFNIKEKRQELYELYKEGKKSKEEIQTEGLFENMSAVTTWLKKKEKEHKSAYTSTEFDIESTDKEDKMGLIINPNLVEKVSINESEPDTDDSIEDEEIDYTDLEEVEDIEELAYLMDDLNKADVTEQISEGKVENRVITEMELKKDLDLPLLKKAETEECPYHCVNGKVFFEALGLRPCPHCCGIERQAKILDENEEVSIYKLLRIPPQYRHITSVPDDVLKDVEMSYYIESSVIEVRDLLNKIVQAVREGKVANIAAYIHVTNRIDIRPFVYGLLREAQAKGIGTVPYISLNTLGALVHASNAPTIQDKLPNNDLEKERIALGNIAYTTNARQKLAREFSCDYYDYCKSSLVILEATADTQERGWLALADLLSERAREGLGTYVFGYHSSTARVVDTLRYMTTQNIHRLDMLNVIEFKTKRNGAVTTMARSFNDVAQYNGELEAGIKVQSLQEEDNTVARRASDIFKGKLMD